MADEQFLTPAQLEARGINAREQVSPSILQSHVEVAGFVADVAEHPAVGPEQGVGLLIPGFTANKASFYSMMPWLAERGYRVISFSQRGQDGSTGSDDPADYALSRLGADVHALADVLELGDEVHLLGHSFGGVVAVEAALQRPERLASLTLWNTGPRPIPVMKPEILDALRAHGHRALWVQNRTEQGLDPDVDLRGEMNPIEQYYYDRLFNTKQAQLEAALDILLTQQERTTELLTTNVPKHVSHGANDDAWPIDWQREWAETLGASYTVIAGGSHTPQDDDPVMCAGVLSAFWDSARLVSR